MGGRGEIMAGCGWSWVVGVKLWLVVGGGIKIMAGCGELLPDRGWWRQNYGWSSVVTQFSNATKKRLVKVLLRRNLLFS